jgi:hypothetical protein
MRFENTSHISTSPVECLRLFDCGAHKEALATILSWLVALKVLHYNAEQAEWIGRSADKPAKD